MPQQELARFARETQCVPEHHLNWSGLRQDLLHIGSDHLVSLGIGGSEWLIDHGRPSPDWRSACAVEAPALREWQVEALEAWVAHGRHGVVQAVTGTGKSRVGIEAIREALTRDFSVVVIVPTIDLVEQWIKDLARHGVKRIGRQPSFADHDVVVATVQSLYTSPPTRPDGKVLLVADECHRYGAGEWRRSLHPSYRRRLGLTATFERNDDGLGELQAYFGGPPVFDIGFAKAIEAGVVARYQVKLLAVSLSPRERLEYDEADRLVRDMRVKLLAADFPAEPFGAFLHEVQRAVDDEDPTIADAARLYLKSFSRRIDVMTGAQEKLDAVAHLAALVKASKGALVFTRRVDVAENVASLLQDSDVRAEAIHGKLSRRERADLLSYLRIGRIKALVAPTVLDEGIDVPLIDLAVVLGGSKSRRQMIQRMGRVLRLKPDGSKATFVVVFAKDTVEDLTANDGAEGCLDLIIEAADEVTHLDVASGLAPQAVPHAHDTPGRRVAVQLPLLDPKRLLREVDPATVPMTRRALDAYRRRHGGSDAAAEAVLRRMVGGMQRESTVRLTSTRGLLEARHDGFLLVVGKDRVSNYATNRADGASWDAVASRTPNQGEAVGDCTANPMGYAKTATADKGQAASMPSATPPSAPPPKQCDVIMPAVPKATEPGPTAIWLDQLERLVALRREGLLTDAEFAAAKSKLLA